MTSPVEQKTLESLGSTVEKEEKNSLLDYKFEDFVSYFSGFTGLREAENEIEKQFDIVKDFSNCWPADDIKQAWAKTQTMDKSSTKGKCWALVLILQLLKRQMRNEDLMESGNVVQKCAALSLLDTSDQTKVEKEDDGLYLTDDINEVFGKAESMKENSEEKLSQNKDELEKTGAAGPAVKPTGQKRTHSSDLTQPCSVDQGLAGTQYGVQETGNNLNAPDDGQSKYDGNTPLQNQAAVEHHKEDQTTYIRIPITQMYTSEPTFTQPDVDVRSRFKLTSGLPSETDIRRRKSYVMSFNSRTNNAEWVYEILNQQTLANSYKELPAFGDVYDKGHLAAAANHRWCREARQDTFLNSNIIPQHEALNKTMWKKLENYCRTKANGKGVRNVHVYTGPIYKDTNTVKLEGKTVPSDFFKVVIVENVDGTVAEPECFLMPNKRPPIHYDLKNYRMDIDTIQRDSKLNFKESTTDLRDSIMKLTLQGENLNEEQCDINIEVRINF